MITQMPLFRIARRRCLAWGGCAFTTHLLNAQEAALIGAIAEQILPLDEEPGAAQTRAVQYVDQQLDSCLARFRPAYHQGLTAFEAACRAETGMSFLELSPEQRQTFLWRLQSGHKLTAFYEMVRAHAELSMRPPERSLFEQPFVQAKHAF